ncbi:MAG: response regulator transcription factor [Roseibium sp.]|uniref:response regulator transcription factor n=1 Tax=Roseibium sp. TaxID=1936156 RepID=UPI001B0A4BD4|nr:response regulator transcription factor [Roseibium sp.]MBO6511933.1 response regulator transcription factor [Roseibium sp.]MBO6893746.1 response regulator transcription factor [Roseibium sp.]MBO6928567.1 response regulator transcription factor [Roseibium sp.]
MNEPRYNAIIADDHAIVRAGLKETLEKPGLIEPDGIRVLAEAGDGLTAIAEVRKHRPHLLLLDVSMPMAGGVEVLIEARRWSKDTKVVVLTGISAVGLVSDLIDTGVDGLFSKASDNEEFYQRLPGILRGQRHISDYFLKILEETPKPPVLTDRERQTLNMILAGRSNKEIAEGLGISVKTVDKHRTSLMQKLKVHSVPQLIARALKEGLIDPSKEL